MSIQIPDLSGVEAWKGGGVLPPGKHLCRIDNATDGRSSGGYAQIEIEWTAVDGEHAGLGIREWVVITERSLGKVRALLDAVGYQIPAGSFQLDASALIGKRAVVLVGQEPDRNDPTVMRSRVKAHDTAGSAPAAGVGDWTQSIGSGPPAGALDDNGRPLPF